MGKVEFDSCWMNPVEQKELVRALISEFEHVYQNQGYFNENQEKSKDYEEDVNTDLKRFFI